MDLKQRRTWNENHKILKDILLKQSEHAKSVQLFLSQHALLHSSSLGNTSYMTLEDTMLNNLDETTFREYPVPNPDTKNSIAWHLWHITRIEDMTMNILVADVQQVFYEGSWLEKLNIQFLHSGNNMSVEEISELSLKIDFNSLLEYRKAVGRQTRKVVLSLKPGQFNMKVQQSRVKRLFEENAVTQNSSWLAEYWEKNTLQG